MTKYNTGNAVGSADPRDLYDNAQQMDKLEVGAAEQYPDRLGVMRKSRAGMEKAFNDFLAASGYQDMGTYGAGVELTAYNQTFFVGGTAWRLATSTSLPYTTTGAGMPETGAFVDIGDAVLRQDLEDNSAGQGSDKVAHTGTADTVTEALGKRAVYVGSVAEDLYGLTGVADAAYKVIAWNPGGAALANPQGGGDFVFKSGVAKSLHDGANIISPTVPTVSSGSLSNFLSGVGETDPSGLGCFVRLDQQKIDITAFGAKLDGAFDDTPAFDAYIQSKNGGRYYIPEGHMMLSAPASFGDRFVRLVGSCSGFKDFSSGPLEIPTLIEFTGATGFTSSQPFHVSDIGFRGDSALTTDLFTLTGAQSEHTVIERCHFQDFKKVCNSNECWGVTFRDNHSYLNIWTIYGVNATQLWTISGNFFIRARPNPDWTAPDGEFGKGGFINIRDGAQNRIFSNDFESSFEESFGGISPIALLRCHGTEVFANHFERNKWNNVVLADGGNNKVRNNFFWFGFDNTVPAGEEYLWNLASAVYVLGTEGQTGGRSVIEDNELQVLYGLYNGTRSSAGGHKGPVRIDPASADTIYLRIGNNTLRQSSGSPSSGAQFIRLVDFQTTAKARIVQTQPVRITNDTSYWVETYAGDQIAVLDRGASSAWEYRVNQTGISRSGTINGNFTSGSDQVTGLTGSFGGVLAFRVDDTMRWNDGVADRTARVTAVDYGAASLTMDINAPQTGTYPINGSLITATIT